MINWVGRARRRVSLWLVAALAVVGAGGLVPAASADDECVSDLRIFAVDSATGHLVEIPSCDAAGFGSAIEVDSSDWTAYLHVFAVHDGAAMVLYAVTANGELWWRRQESRAASLGEPVRIAPEINWAQPSVFAPQVGYLHAGGGAGAPLRTFRHENWASGGTEVSEETSLFAGFAGPPVTAARWAAYAEGFSGNTHFRVWQQEGQDGTGRWHDDAWYPSGELPSWIVGVEGKEPRLYGLAPSGEVVLLSQAKYPDRRCRTFNPQPWEIAASSIGHYSRVVAPVWDTYPAPPSVAPPPIDGAACGLSEGLPWEWQ